MRLPVLVAFLTVAWATAAPAAQAGTYDVVSCGAAGGVNHAWRSFNEESATLSTGARCSPPSGGAESGLFAVDRIPGPPNADKERGAGWRLTAPAGTRITRVAAQYYLGQRSDGEWFPYLRTDSGQVLETCQPPGGEPACERGISTPDPLGPMWSYAMNASAVEAGVECRATAGACGNGALLHAAWASLYFTRVQITDAVPPNVPAVTAPAGAPSYLRGVQTFTVSSSDNTGIHATRLEVDGSSRSTIERSCDYTYVVPCGNEPGAAHVLDTRALADGPHSLRAVAEDPAGNEASRSSQITTDNTPPAPPLKLRVHRAKGVRATSPKLGLRWTNPPNQVAPIVAAHWSICRQKKPSRCRSGSRRGSFSSARGNTGVLRPAVADGRWEARLWLEDAAGNVDPATAAGPVRIVVKRKSPRIRIRSVRRDGNRVAVRGTAAVRSGRIRVRVQRRIGERVRRISSVVTIRRGRWGRTLTLSGRLARASRVAVVVRFDERGAYASQIRRRLLSS